MNANGVEPDLAPALWRARSEFLEMPGLRLTPWQAARLWGLERREAEDLLAALARSGFLYCTSAGAYMRRSSR